MPAPIEGKIASILDEYSVVINVGRLHGVIEGMSFVIYSPGEEEIRDPDTGKSLGCLEIVKGHVRAAHVQENLALCSSYRTGVTAGREGEAGTETQTLSGAMVAEAMGLKTRVESRLNVNPVQVSGMAHGVAISIGDRVRSLDMLGSRRSRLGGFASGEL